MSRLHCTRTVSRSVPTMNFASLKGMVVLIPDWRSNDNKRGSLGGSASGLSKTQRLRAALTIKPPPPRLPRPKGVGGCPP